MQKALKIPSRILKQNVVMPLIGFGCFMVPCTEQGKQSILSAIKMGYRHFDTAQFYKNHKIVGEAIRQCGIPRKQFFVTSKIWYTNAGYQAATKAIKDSLQQLDIDYIDLMLTHWPGNSTYSYKDPKNSEIRKGTWTALEQGYKSGKIKSIGVSNFRPRHLDELAKYSEVKPVCNQFELHPLYQQIDTIDYCEKHKIQIVAYCSLMRMDDRIMKNKTVLEIAKSHSRSVGEVLLRWALAHEFTIIPKSSNPERQLINLRVMDFDLSQDQVKEIDKLNQMTKLSWDPEQVA